MGTVLSKAGELRRRKFDSHHIRPLNDLQIRTVEDQSGSISAILELALSPKPHSNETPNFSRKKTIVLGSRSLHTIIASKFDPSSQRIVRYLSETYDIAINTAFFSVFEDDGHTLLATDWLLDHALRASKSNSHSRELQTS